MPYRLHTPRLGEQDLRYVRHTGNLPTGKTYLRRSSIFHAQGGARSRWAFFRYFHQVELSLLFSNPSLISSGVCPGIPDKVRANSSS